MQQSTLLVKVTDVFRSVFDQPELVITEESNASTVEGWDSLAHINLIVALEEIFNISFSTQELGEMTCVGDLLKTMKNKGIVE